MRRVRFAPARARGALVLIAAAALPFFFATPRAVALDDELYGRQWGLDVVGARAAWDAGIFGQDIDIAIVDTGVHLTHQDLVPNLRPGHNVVAPASPPQDDQCENSDCGHGTHVAGIAAAVIDNGGSVGVAPRARILPVKVLDASGSGTTDGVAAGIRWAVANGAEVVNLSLGNDLQGITGPPDAIIAAVRHAWQQGVICVFAAGNSFVLGSGFADEPAIIVSATDRRDASPDFSSGVGGARWGIAAPGGGNTFQLEADENIWSTAWDPSNATNGYTEKRGTSMSAPFVSGAAALLRSTGLSAKATVDRLLATAKDLGPAGNDSTFGAGRLDVRRAVAGLSPAGAGGGGSVTTTPPATSPPSGGGSPPATTATTVRRSATPPASTPTTAPPGAPAAEPPTAPDGTPPDPGGTETDSGLAQGDVGPDARDDADDRDDGGGSRLVLTLLAGGALAAAAFGAARLARRRQT